MTRPGAVPRRSQPTPAMPSSLSNQDVTGFFPAEPAGGTHQKDCQLCASCCHLRPASPPPVPPRSADQGKGGWHARKILATFPSLFRVSPSLRIQPKGVSRYSCTPRVSCGPVHAAPGSPQPHIQGFLTGPFPARGRRAFGRTPVRRCLYR